MYISDKQKETMKLIGQLTDEIEKNRWFIQAELPGVTLHTMNALVEKGFLHCRESDVTGLYYYKCVTPKTDEEWACWNGE
jgi:hypothetical protein